ncbi:MAG: HAD family hydrolase [Candidatus Methylomirabilales bacterium]
MKKYGIWLFDCDGVILDSNPLKTEAFRRVGMAHGAREAESLVRYHLNNGGISRFDKLEFFFREICGEIEFHDKLRAALADYGEFVSAGLHRCPELPGVRDFLERLRRAKGIRTFVVSGSHEEELREVFKVRGLDQYFDGIFGSPAKKCDIITSLCSRERSTGPPRRIVFCGDSRLDYEVAMACCIEFIMVYGYTEWEGWREAIRGDIISARDFRELVGRVEV